MSTASTFTQALSIPDLLSPTKSVGAHLAAKLQVFHTDERTLTDELCDMLCIWLGMESCQYPGGLSSPLFTLTLSKTTIAQEVKNGADLEFIVSSPLGYKRCLIQAKVLDPSSKKLRCDSVLGWKKLRQQLILARQQVGDLAFLLIYIPGEMLDGSYHGYPTYEQQQGNFTPSGKLNSCYGATFVAVNDLITPKGRWRNTKIKIPHITPGQYKGGVPFWQLFLELFLCRRSSWIANGNYTDEARRNAFRVLEIGAKDISEDAWRRLQAMADQWLPFKRNADEEPEPLS